MKILETERLIIREIVESDADFILDLLNQPSFIKYIGDRNVRTIDEAKDFLETRYRKSYEDNGFGLYLVELKSEIVDTLAHARVSAFESEIQTPRAKIVDTLAHARVSALEHQTPNSELRTPIGICGFVKRDDFEYPDIGFAFLPQFEKKGYAIESALAMMKYGQEVLGFKKVLAIATQDNESSRKLLEKLGFKFDELIEMPNNEVLKLFSWRVKQ